MAVLTIRRQSTVSRMSITLRSGLTHLFLSVCAIGFVLPFLWMLGTSLRPLPDILANPIAFIPAHPYLQNYVEAWQAAPFGAFLGNTIIITLTSLVGDVASSAVVAYGFARIKFAGRGFWFVVLL